MSGKFRLAGFARALITGETNFRRIVEELFYRGYAIERIESLGLNRFWAVVIPLTIFAVAHWTGGWANILIALALGVILSVFYVWRRDLVANMIAHFLVDLIGNIH